MYVCYLLQDTPVYIEPSGYPGVYNLFILLLFFHDSKLLLFSLLFGKNTDWSWGFSIQGI